MIVQGGHQEDAFAFCKFEIKDLQHDTEGFTDRDNDNQSEDQPLASHQRHNTQCGTQRKGTGIAHEQLSRVNVKPEEAENSTHQGKAKTAQEYLMLRQCNATDGDECCGRDQSSQSIQSIGE